MEETTKCSKQISSPTLEQKIDENFDENFEHLHQIKTHHGFFGQYQGIWFNAHVFQSVMSVHKHFQAKDSDIILATLPKSGTTWLKALTYSIANRCNHSVDQSPLLFSNPHQLIPFLEYKEIGENITNHVLGRRIFSTHIPYQCLPKSILLSKSKIIYLCRNPLDVFASIMAFAAENELVKLAPMEIEFQLFRDGIQSYGPFWDHILGYWNQSLKSTDADLKVLFLRYEDLKNDVNSGAKKMAEFLGFPFSVEEEANGVVEDITRLCSFGNLKDLDVNRMGSTQTSSVVKVKNSSFFRKAEVGDWKNYVTISMAKQLEKLMEQKFAGSGLTWEIHSEETAN